MHIQQIVKISLHQQTTETPSKPCFAFFNLISNNHKRSEKSTRRSHFDAYIGQINVNHQTTETASKPCFAMF